MELLSSTWVLDIYSFSHALGALKQHVKEAQGRCNHLVCALHMEIYQHSGVLADWATLESVILHSRLLPYFTTSGVDSYRRIKRDERLDLNHALDAVRIVVWRLLSGCEVEDDRHVCRVNGQIASCYEWSIDNHVFVEAEGQGECSHEESLHEHIGRERVDEFEIPGSL